MATLQRTAKRIYSPTALEQWFCRLEKEWEPRFQESVLVEARELYTEGVIRELELGDGDAIIHCKLERKACYALIEWEGDHLRVRGSEEPQRFNEVLAAAGLYEIEELVAEEVSPETPGITAAENETSAGRPNDGESETEPESIPARKLEVDLRVDNRGLLADPRWRNGRGDSVRALLVGGDEKDAPSRAERESLVRLTGLARKAGFEFHKRQGVFLLRDGRKMGAFMKDELTMWRRYFGIELDAEAKLVEKGVQSLQLVGRAQTSPNNRNGMRLEWGLRCNGTLLGADQALRLARQGGGPTLVRGVGLVELDEAHSETIEESFLAQNAAGANELPRYLLFSRFAEAVRGLQLEGELEEWKRQVEVLDDRAWPLPTFFRHYQAEGVSWMAGHCEMGCHPLLADEMGLGKTVQVLGLMAARPLVEALRQRPHLVVCPASVVPVWKGEVEQYFPQFSTRILRAADPFQIAPEDGNGLEIWLASYTQLRRHRHLLSEAKFGYAVLDEAQQIKNPDAKVSQACMQIQAEHRIALTGTPLENRALDLWNLFRFLMPGLLGSRRSFELGIEGEGRNEFLEVFKRQLHPFTLRRTKATVVRELPPKVEMELACPMTSLQVKLYRELVDQGEKEFGGKVGSALQDHPMHFFSLLTRLRQVCCDPDLLPGCHAGLQNSGKLMVLQDKLESILDSGSKVVIFSQFTSLLDRVNRLVKEAFPSVPRYSLTGRTRDREAPVRDFQALQGGALFLISLRAGGVGITLHAADYVFLLDPWWNPAVEAQAIDRVHRIGQEKPVFVYRMVTRGTIEERVEVLKREKRELFDGMVGALDGWAGLAKAYGALSELIALRSDEIDG